MLQILLLVISSRSKHIFDKLTSGCLAFIFSFQDLLLDPRDITLRWCNSHFVGILKVDVGGLIIECIHKLAGQKPQLQHLVMTGIRIHTRDVIHQL